MDVEKAKRAVIRSFNFTPNFVATAEDRDCIIKLLEEGDKYKKVVEEIEGVFGPGKVFYVCKNKNFQQQAQKIMDLKYIIDEIKQKYFPETFKKTVTVEIEAKDTDDLALGLGDIGVFVSCPGKTKMRIIDIGRMQKVVKSC